MSDNPQFGDLPDPEESGSDPFGLGAGLGPGGFDLSKIDLNEVMRMLQSDGPVNWELARRTALPAALNGEPDPPVAPADHEQLADLARAAQTLVVAETGLTATFGAPLRTIGRGEWAELHLEALAPVLEALATRFREAIVVEAEAEDEPGDLGDVTPPGADALGIFGMGMGPGAMSGLAAMLAPVLLGVQAGSMVGYLARYALGRYDLPLPSADPPSLCFVVANIDRFEADWSLPRDDLRFMVALHEVVRAAERSVPWLQPRLVELAVDYVSAYELDADALESQLGGFDPADPESMAGIAEHPEALLGAMRSPHQLEVLGRIQAITSVLEGYAELVVENIGEHLVGSYRQIQEALERHRVERGEAGRFIEGLLGLQLDRSHYDQGQEFCRGVVERVGLEGLNRIWEHQSRLPTPAELDAPGLWLARIDLPDGEGPPG